MSVYHHVKDKLLALEKKFRTKVTSLKKEIKALYFAYKRPDVPLYAKIFVMIVLGYALSPIDLIPDFIPILGYLDDFILIPLGITLAIKMIPPKVLEECRVQAENDPRDGKPKNWIAGAIIILVWIVIICLVIFKLILPIVD